MRVLLISPLPPPNGGIAHWTTIILDHSKKTGDEVEILNIAPKNREVDGRTQLMRVLGGITSVFQFYRQLKASVKKSVPDVVHICTSASLALLRDYCFLKYLKKNSVPTVYHLHFGRVPQMKKIKGWEWGILKKNIILADDVIAINKSTFDALKDVKEADRLYNIPNPVNMNSLPELIDYSKHKKYIFYLGWIVRTKGIEELLTAWKEIKNDYSEWSLVLTGPVNNEYKKVLEEMGLCEEVKFTGELAHEEAMEYMRKAGIFVLPSYSEGFPNVIEEAMALKTPVIATDVGSIHEMIEDDRIIAMPKNVQDLKNKLTLLLNSENLRRECADRLYEKASKQYGISVVYQQYKKIWDR